MLINVVKSLKSGNALKRRKMPTLSKSIAVTLFYCSEKNFLNYNCHDITSILAIHDQTTTNTNTMLPEATIKLL